MSVSLPVFKMKPKAVRDVNMFIQERKDELSQMNGKEEEGKSKTRLTESTSLQRSKSQ